MGALKDAKLSAGNRIPDKTRVVAFIKKAECKTSKEKGNPMIEVDFEVANGDHQGKEWRAWLGTQDTGTWGFKTASLIRAAGLAHMIDAEVQAPDQDIANALLGKYVTVDVALEMEKEKDGTQKMYQGSDGNMYPSSRNNAIAYYPANAQPVAPAQQAAAPAPQQAPVQHVAQAPVQQVPVQQYQQPVQQAPAQQHAPQYAQPPAQQYQQPVQPIQQQAPQYAPPPQGAPAPQQFQAPGGQAPAPWQMPPQAPTPAKKSKAKQG